LGAVASGMAAHQVLVADDQVLVRAGVAALLGAMPGFICAGAVADGLACRAACAAATPDVLLLDLDMPPGDGLGLTRDLVQAHPGLRVLILTASTDAALARQTLAAGAAGFICKDFVLDELEHALRSVLAGRVYLSPTVALASVQPPARPDLSPRQRDVLKGIARGASNKEIARQLGLSVKTVEYHRAELIQRTDLHDVASLTRFALQHGLVD
jgi:DNA-binding NarL/FixJ family response regulator